MATTFHNTLENLRATQVWKSIFRRGRAITNRTRSVAIFGNLFLHWMPVKVREKSLRDPGDHWSAADVLLPSGGAESLPRHEGFAVCGVERGVSKELASHRGTPDGAASVLAHVSRVLPRRL